MKLGVLTFEKGVCAFSLGFRMLPSAQRLKDPGIKESAMQKFQRPHKSEDMLCYLAVLEISG